MNKVILMGRLTAEPEVRYTQGNSQTAIAKFSIAVDRKFKQEGQPTADFFNCTCFGKQASFVEKYLHKGIKIVMNGRVQNNNYTNKDGQKVYGICIMVEEIEFAESKNANGGNESGYGGGTNNIPTSGGADDGFMSIPDSIDEELPFN